ncbi:MAG: metalloendopeptidase glycoprotease family [Thermoleophilia bacterium]|nr:metalloendopeptidase glycoprotease family [Thermoleophilia bacterium]
MTARTYLAIESSCDETAAAIVRGREVLAEAVATQAELHERFGGVVPEIASRRHLELVDIVVRDVLECSGLERVENVDAVAVTRGPGLVGALLVGIAAAKARAWAAGVPLVPVDHLLGHVASALLDPDANLEPPFLCVLVSGGHTLLLDVDVDMTLTLLGSTRDDAAGEAFDKGARLLGLDMPGGPALSALAATADRRDAVEFTPAMLHHDTLDTSFSGIKTALSIALRERAAIRANEPTDAQLAAGFEDAIVSTIVGSVKKLLRQRGPTSGHASARDRMAVVGGVAANATLRTRMAGICREFGVQTVHAPLRWCGDNAAMIGVAAQFCPEHAGPDAWQLDAYATTPLFRQGKLVPN